MTSRNIIFAILLTLSANACTQTPAPTQPVYLENRVPVPADAVRTPTPKPLPNPKSRLKLANPDKPGQTFACFLIQDDCAIVFDESELKEFDIGELVENGIDTLDGVMWKLSGCSSKLAKLGADVDVAEAWQAPSCRDADILKKRKSVYKRPKRWNP